MDSTSRHHIASKLLSSHSKRQAELFKKKAIPGYLVVFSILVLSFLWGGLKPVGFAAVHVIAWIALALSMKFNQVSPVRPAKNRLIWLAVSLQALIFTNIVFHGSPALGWEIWFFTWDCFIVLLVVSHLPRNCLKGILLLFLLVGILLTSKHTILIVSGGITDSDLGFTKHAYHFGVFSLLLIFPSVGCFFSSHRKLLRYIAILAAGLSLVYILIDVKTGTILLTVLGIAMFSLRSKRHSMTNTRLLFIMLIFGIALAAFNLSGWVFQDFAETLQLENPATYHWYPMHTALKAGIEHPLAGIGAGNFPDLSGVYKSQSMAKHFYRAHNGLLEFFAEFGLLSLLVLCALIYHLLNSAFRVSSRRQISRWIHRGFKVSILLMIPASLWDFGPQVPANLITIALGVGILLADKSEKQRRLSDSDSRLWLLPLFLSSLFIPGLLAGINFEMARYEERHGMLRSAARHYERAVLFSPFDDRFTSGAALVHSQIFAITGQDDDYKQAVKYLEKSIARNGNQAELHFAKANLLQFRNEVEAEQIEESLRSAYELDPTDYRFATAYAYSLTHSFQHTESERILWVLLNNTIPEDYEPFAREFCDVWTDPHRLSKFIRNVRFDIPGDLFVAILCELKSQGMDLLVKNLAEELTVDGEDIYFLAFSPDSQVSWVRLLLSLGLDSEATKVIDVFIRQNPTSRSTGVVCALKGSYYRRQNNYEAASIWYEKAKHAGLNDLEFQLRYIALNRQMKTTLPILNELIRLAAKFPNSARVHYELAREFERKNETLKALDEFRKANELSGGRYSIEQKRNEDILDIPELWRDGDL